MKHTIVRYVVKPERAAENEALVQAVYEDLAARAPDGLAYETYVLEGGLEFVHLAHYDEVGVLSANPAFRRFRDGLEDRVSEPPVPTPARKIGGYGWPS